MVLALLSGCGGGAPSSPKPQAFPVRVAAPVQREIQQSEVYTGRFAPVEQVELRARVSGYVMSVHFDEGQKIKKDQLMFQIDPRPFDAAKAAAEARVEQAMARVSLSSNNLVRAENLVKKNAISREEADIRRSEFAQAQADLLAAKAGLRQASLDREFADVKAPIAGIASRYLATPGNFISGGAPGSTLLATLVPHSPIHCYFEVDERQVLRFTRMFFKGQAEGRSGERPKVDIAVSDSDTFEFKGEVDFVENRLDASTATFQLRALVKNENEFLTPGLFAKVRIPVGPPMQAILVPDHALGFDQSRRFAWALQDDNTVSRKYVEVGGRQGEQRIVNSGLATDDRIVVSGIQLLRDGMPVAPSEESPKADAATDSKPTESKPKA